MAEVRSEAWWGVAEAAAHCSIQPGTWRDYVARGFAPAPDDPDRGAPSQRRRPRWRAETVAAWHAARPGKGGRPSVATRAPVNVVRTAAGKLRPVCEFCGKVGRAAAPFDGGDLTLWDVAQGWGEVPYPPDFVHEDGSRGSLWRCPACSLRMDRGEVLEHRAGPADPADAAPGAWDTDLGFGHVHDWILDRSDYEPCVCGAVMPEAPF